MRSMRHFRIRSPLRILSDRRGATAVEFAMLAIPVIGVLIAALQMAVISFYSEALQTVAATAARQVMVGNVQSQGLTQAQFKTLVCNAAPAPFSSNNCNALMVDIQSAPSFSALTTQPITITSNSNGTGSCTCSFAPGGEGSAVIVRVMYEWPVFGGPLGIGIANEGNGTRLMVGTAVFQTEPY